MDDSHAEDSHRAAEIFDVKCCCEGSLELTGPFRIAAENQNIVNVDGNVDHQGGGDQRIAGVVTLELM